MISYYSELKIIFSNCLYQGSAFLDLQSEFMTKIRDYFVEVGIEYRGLNINRVSGDHTSFTVTVMGVFYNYSNKLPKNEIVNINEMLVFLVDSINDFTCNEVRIEHTRHRGIFNYLHPSLRAGL